MLKLSRLLAASAAMGVLGTSIASAHMLGGRKAFPFDPVPNHSGPQIRMSPQDLARSRTVWTPVTHRAPINASTALLLTDGSVIVQSEESSTWYRLVPDITGSYINGTWKKAASLPSNYGPLYYSSAVLPDGRLIVNGGEYNLGGGAVETPLGAIYDPLKDTWTPVAPPSGWNTIGDAPDTVLADGTLLMGRSCCSTDTVLLNAKTLGWTPVGSGKADADAEEGFTLLPSGNVLAVDVLNNRPLQSEQYNPATGKWSLGASTVVDLVDHNALETGATVQRPQGNVFAVGGTGNTAIFNDATQTWAAGPSFPATNGHALYVDDGPAALLQDGNVLCVGSRSNYGADSHFFEFNGKKLIPVPGTPNAPNDPSFYFRMLELPNGQILMTDGSSDVEVYTHVGKAHPAWAPTISQISDTLTRGSTYPLAGVHLNGFSQGAAYGDDAQMATNYPIVRITNVASHHVFYARTHDHSSMAIASAATVSTMVDIPATAETGASMLEVIANGVPSAPKAVTIN